MASVPGTTISTQESRRKITKELASAVSTQALVANRLWIALTTVAIFSLAAKTEANGNFALPFSLGEVDKGWFYPVAFSIIVVLSIAFAAAHAQQVRAQRLAQSVIERMTHSQTELRDDIHLRDYFDMCRMPSLNRVAPLAQHIRGPYQFYSSRERCPKWLKFASVTYYALLKLTSHFVYYCLPIFALIIVYSRITVQGKLQLIISFAGALALIALVQVFIADVFYSVHILTFLWKRRN